MRQFPNLRATTPIAGLLALSLLVAAPGSAQSTLDPSGTQGFPHLELTEGATVFESHVDLGQVRLPMLEISNPSTTELVALEVLARSNARGLVRSHRVELEPGGTLTLGFGPETPLSSLSIFALGEFTARLVADGRSPERELWVASSAMAAGTSADKLGGGCTPKCFKQWELTCSAGGCDNLGPFIDNGKVLCSLATGEADRVYWRLNVPKTPHVPWETVGDQGLTAAWGLIDVDGCPTVVQNSLGHVYDITFP